MTTQSLALVSLVVRDYDEALAFYVGKLGFTLVEDKEIPAQGKRWVVVAPPGGTGAHLLLARAANAEQARHIGNQAGGRVFLFLHTDDFARDYAVYCRRGVRLCATRSASRTGRSPCSRTCTAIAGTCCSRPIRSRRTPSR